MSAPQAGARTSGAARRLVRALVLPLCGTAAFSGRVESEQLPAFHLGSLYEIDQLLLDENGDGVPDRLNVLFVLPESPSAADQAAAAEIALRLGFETMALDLPVARIAAPDWNEEARPGAVRIAIGARAVREAGLSEAFGLPFELEAGEGLARVFRRAREGGDERWIVVAGGDEEGLLRGARYLAGSLPGVKTAASGESLRDVADEIGEWAARRLEGLGADSAGVWFRGVRARSPVDPVRLEGWIELFGAGEGADSVLLDLLREEASVRASGPDFAPDSAALRFQGLRSVALIAGDDRVELPTLAAPPPPGPVPGRPGGGGGELDLSSVFTTQGLLSGSELPTGISAILIPEGDPLSGVIDLAARLGVESSGIAVPATRLPGEEGQAAPVSVLLGSMERHPGIQSLADSGAIKLDDLAPGEGLVRSLPVRGDPRLVATGIDDAGRARAAQSLAVDFPRLRGTDGPTFGDVEEELWAFLSGYSPAGQAAIGLYKLDRLLEEAREDGATGVHILMSVEKADSLLGEYVRAFAQARLPLAEVTVEIDDRDVTRAKTIFDDAFDVPSEAGRFREALRAEVLPRVSRGAKVELRARLSEPPKCGLGLRKMPSKSFSARGRTLRRRWKFCLRSSRGFHGCGSRFSPS